MFTTRWTLSRASAVTITFALVVSFGASMAEATAARAASVDMVKYYEVADSYAGKPENLSEIAKRFLGSPTRANEIFDLNVGRTQPDGGELTDANSLHQGWILVLPWDAVGAAVRRGELPVGVAAQPVTPPTPVTPSNAPTKAATGRCARPQSTGADSQAWAQRRLAPQQAWRHGRGDGVTVAVVDSGVDASQPQLAGRVAPGVDIANGSGKGNVDCLGSGTAMAGLIAGQGDGALVGMAPGSTILPIRVVTDTPSAAILDQVKAIEVAVSAGSTVIALGSFVDITQPLVHQAVTNAADHDVVVVACASTGAAGTLPDQVIRVGAVGVDGRLAQAYTPGSVDVTAPGVDITSLGIRGTGDFRGTGTQYAVAFVAGEAALLRGLDKRMPARAVVQQITQSASHVGTGTLPDPAFGWGFIDPARAMDLAAQSTPSPATAGSSDTAGGTRTGALVVAVLVAFVIVGLLVFRVRRALSSGPSPDARPGPLAAAAPISPPPPDDRPPGTPAKVLRHELRASGALPRRTPSARPTMAFDHPTTSLPGPAQPDAGAESRGGHDTVEIATAEIAPVHGDLL